MRIIGGKFKGVPLASPKSQNIRPTGDKVKQALFTKLQFDLENSIVCDLFCGSGALGIEALSRGAKKVYFVDKDKRSLNLTKQNLSKLEGDYKLFLGSYDKALKSFDQKFDFIFVDPPYASGVYEDVLLKIQEYDMLSENGIVVCEHPNELIIKTNRCLIDQKRYGTVTLSFYK